MNGLWKLGCVAAMLAALAGCGGGGGGGGDSAKPSSSVSEEQSRATVTFVQTSLDVTSIEGEEPQAEFSVRLDYEGQEDIWMGLEEEGSLIVSGDSTPMGEYLLAKVRLAGNLAPGVYESRIVSRLCVDEACTVELQNGHQSLPVRYTVKPNIHAPSELTFQRKGRDPAPAQTVNVDVPAEAGQVTASLVSDTPGAMSVSFDGTHLSVETKEVRAGSYQGTVVLQGASDIRYRKLVKVSYEVAPPIGGEQALSVDKTGWGIDLQQGQTASTRIKVTRPTWTSSWTAPVWSLSSPLFQFKDLGNDEYEIVANAGGMPSGYYSAELRFDAGPTGGSLIVPVRASVDAAFKLGNGFPFLDIRVNDNSTESDLLTSISVDTADHVAAGWRAVSKSPWLKVLRGSGTTGVDQVRLQIDKAYLPQIMGGAQGLVEVGIDRPGTEPQTLTVQLSNGIQMLWSVTSGSLVGDKGRVFVMGNFSEFADWSQLLASGRLSVTGAVVNSVKQIADSRLLSNDARLVLDLSGAKPGQPVTIKLDSAFMSSQVQVNVVEAQAVPTGYVALPYGRYRPAQYVAALKSVYWAGEQRLFAWSHDNTAWRLQDASVSNAIDVAVSGDEKRLYAVAGRDVLAYDPLSLAFLRKATYYYNAVLFSGPSDSFDAQAPDRSRALTVLADGRSFASMVDTMFGGANGNRSVFWITGYASPDTAYAEDLTSSPRQGDPGTRIRNLVGVSGGAAIVRSPGGQVLLEIDPDGMAWRYTVDEHGGWTQIGALPAGLGLAAVNDAGTLLLRADGVLQSNLSTPGSSLSSKLPLGHVAGGYGLTGDGRFALVYGYRIEDMVAGGQRARDAGVWVIDLRGVTNGRWDLAPVLGRVNLPDAVGCTTATLAPGESCVHQASLSVDAAGLNVFVTGPRGVAAVALPAAWIQSPSGNLSAAGVAASRASAQAMSVGALAKPARKGFSTGFKRSGH